MGNELSATHTYEVSKSAESGGESGVLVWEDPADGRMQPVDVHARDVHGWTALMHAAESNKPDMVAALLNAGADPRVLSTSAWGMFLEGSDARAIAKLVQSSLGVDRQQVLTLLKSKADMAAEEAARVAATEQRAEDAKANEIAAKLEAVRRANDATNTRIAALASGNGQDLTALQADKVAFEKKTAEDETRLVAAETRTASATAALREMQGADAIQQELATALDAVAVGHTQLVKEGEAEKALDQTLQNALDTSRRA